MLLGYCHLLICWLLLHTQIGIYNRPSTKKAIDHSNGPDNNVVNSQEHKPQVHNYSQHNNNTNGLFWSTDKPL